MPTFGPKHLQPISMPTLAMLEQKSMDKSSPILLRIFKEESELEIWKQNREGKFVLLKTYPICRWSGELGPKVREGDRQAPEGFYFITPELMNPRSSYYLSFNLGYPNEFDRAHGRSGAHLMVHGDCSSRGCYAMTDEQIQEIFALARESFDGGQLAFQVQALPFRMTAKNMARHRNNPNLAFWRMLKEGSDQFELTKTQPKIDVCEKRYVFNAHFQDPGALFDGKSQCPAYDVPNASVIAQKKQSDEREAAVLAKLLPAAPIVTGRDGDTHQSFAGATNRPAAVATGVVPTSDDGRNVAASKPAGETVTGSTNNATAVVPTPPNDPRKSGTSTANSSNGSTRASLGATNGNTRRTREAPSEPEPVAQPVQQQTTPPAALPGATPIRSTGGFSYR